MPRHRSRLARSSSGATSANAVFPRSLPWVTLLPDMALATLSARRRSPFVSTGKVVLLGELGRQHRLDPRPFGAAALWPLSAEPSLDVLLEQPQRRCATSISPFHIAPSQARAISRAERHPDREPLDRQRQALRTFHASARTTQQALIRMFMRQVTVARSETVGESLSSGMQNSLNSRVSLGRRTRRARSRSARRRHAHLCADRMRGDHSQNPYPCLCAYRRRPVERLGR